MKNRSMTSVHVVMEMENNKVNHLKLLNADMMVAVSPNCIYAGQRYDRRIVVLKCNNGEPVDLDSTVQIG